MPRYWPGGQLDSALGDHAGLLHLRAEIDVAPNIQIELPVAVVVEESRAQVQPRAEVHAIDVRFGGDIGERAVAVVAIEHVRSILHDVEVGVAVVVVVAHHAAQPIPGARNPGFVGDIRERAVAIVVVQGIARRQAAAVKVARADEIDVRPAIAVEIGHADTGAGLVHDIGDALVAFQVNEPDARQLRDVIESRRGVVRAASGKRGRQKRHARHRADRNQELRWKHASLGVLSDRIRGRSSAIVSSWSKVV